MNLFIPILMITTASAANMPQGSQYDSRIQYVHYNPDDVVTIRALPGLGSRIVFAKQEKILDVASGFSEGWEFFSKNNILYIKPKSIRADGGRNSPPIMPRTGQWNTNLMVTTNKRLYDFDLELLPSRYKKNARRRRVAYRIEFKYPEDEVKICVYTRTQEKLKESYPPHNWSYSMQVGESSSNIVPTMVYDDGRFTYLKFPNNRDIPTVFIRSEDKSESLVNTHMAEDILVVHRVARQLILRLGHSVVGIHNDQYDPDGLPPVDGTTIPSLKRIIVDKNKKYD